ncbi:MAG TPA: hypothetical protein DCQ31_14870 [Bacteroidales bacterium]|nr:hypothetical protein [Bacteroidales bacterium]
MNKNYSVLIVDDVPQNIQIIVECIEQLNRPIKIYRANSGASACEICFKKVPDVVITDWNMPGMNGVELVEQLKNNELTKDIPIIMCTGVMLTSENLRTALAAGAFDYIRKPIDKLELEARLLSALKHSETLKTLKNERMQFLDLLNAIPEPIYVSDFETSEIIFANEQKFKIFGSSILGEKCHAIFHHNNKPCEDCSKNVLKLNQTEIVRWEHFYPEVDKTFYNIDKVITWQNGRKVKFQISFDITELKKAENEIKKLSTAVEQSPVSIVITDLSGAIVYANPRFSELTGYAFDDVSGKNPRLLKSGKTPPETFVNLWNTLTKGEIWQGEFINRKKSGEEFIEFATVAPIFNSENDIVNYVAIKEDITKRKQIEQSLIESESKLRESNATKDKFFSIIAHDLKNPFNVISGFSDILVQNIQKNQTEKALTIAQTINNAAKNAFDLLQNLLVWANTQTNRISFSPFVFDIKQAVESAVNQLEDVAKRKQIELQINIQPSFVLADLEMVNTILRNVISNAIKFSYRNTKIEITSEQKDLFILIHVKDYGVGISKNSIDRLFKIEYNISSPGTMQETGTGLGLILCKEFVEKNNGTISAYSEPGQGATFTFSLPASKTGSIFTPIENYNSATELHQADKAYLQPYVAKLKEIKFYEISLIRKVLEHIKMKNAAIEIWKNQLLYYVRMCDETGYDNHLKF